MKKKILIILLILTLAFIWGQSMLPKSVSASESGGVLSFIRPFLEIFVGEGNSTDHLVRKIAHFVEYAALGVELALLIVAKWIGADNGRAKCLRGEDLQPSNSDLELRHRETDLELRHRETTTLTSQIMSLGIWTRGLIGLLFAFTIAAIDETIQIFSSRGPGITDVLLDTAGAATGLLFVMLIYFLRGRRECN